MAEHADLLIVGGGPVGATLALALRESGLRVVVLEARDGHTPCQDPRVLALSEGSRQLLQRLGIWSGLAACATPIRTIHVSQRGSLGRTVLRAEEMRQEALGYVLPYTALSNALDQALGDSTGTTVYHGAQAEAVTTGDTHAAVRYTQGGATHIAEAALVVLADGGRSLQEIPGLRRQTRDYGQSAVVGLVETDQPTNGVAYERFTPQGPVALLPYGGNRYALVWTAVPETATALCTQQATAFLDDLQRHFGDRAGRFVQIVGRATFPLKLSQVRPVTATRLAVIGNAAQTLHPVAGQGFNLGLRDAWELAHTVLQYGKQALGSPAMLEAYRKRRRLDTGGGMWFTDFLVRVFSNDIPGLSLARGAGLGLLELMPPVRHFIARRMSFGANG